MVYRLDYTDSEVWKVIHLRGHEGLEMYEVSNLGRVRSRDRIIERKGGGTYARKGKVRRSFLCARGFVTTTLLKSCGKRFTIRVHRLVAEMFLPREIGKDHILFVDGDRRNCRVTNLMRVSRISKSSYIP